MMQVILATAWTSFLPSAALRQPLQVAADSSLRERVPARSRRGLAAEVLINLSSATTVDVHLVVGGAVSKLDLDYTSVTPAFRAASAHIFAGAS